MKFNFLSVLALSILSYSGFSQTPTEISVRFTGFDKSKDKKFVEVMVPDIVAPFKQQTKIGEKGEFAFNLNIKQEREILIYYDQRTIPLIVNPGDHVNLTMKYSFSSESK